MTPDLYRGNSILVRPIQPDDMSLLHEWLKSPSFAFYRPSLGILCPTVELLRERFAALAEIEPPLEIEVLVLHRATLAAVGLMSLSGIDPLNRKAEFSMGFVRGQGTRCTMEALHFALEHAYATMNLRKLVFYAAADNSRAVGLMRHWGIPEEGLLRGELLLADGRAADLRRFALFKEEWESGPLRQQLRKLVPLVPLEIE